MFSTADRHHMSHALRLAERGLYGTSPNPRVGCVLVNDGVRVGEGWHQQAGGPHAEVHALQAAAAQAKGATAYVTLEPCSHHGRTPPCADALVASGVSRVVVAMQDPNPQVAGNGMRRLREAGIQVDSGLLEAEARALNPGFLRRMQGGRPWLRCKLAMSLDGRTAMADGTSQWITGPAARADVHWLRARSCMVITGAGTARHDNPRLTVRLDTDQADAATEARAHHAMQHPPRPVLIDSQLSTPPTHALVRPGATVLTCRDEDHLCQTWRENGVELVRLPADNQRVAISAVAAWLQQAAVNEVLLEAGAELAGAFLRAGLVDELWVYLAPKLMGPSARPLLALPDIASMEQTIPLQLSDIRQIGDDLRLIYLCQAPT